MKKLLLIIILLWCTDLKAQLSIQQGYIDSVYTEYFRLNDGGWTAGDATLSVPLPDGRTLWLFGDSYLAEVNVLNNTLPCLFQIRNCMVVQDTFNPPVLTTYIDQTQSGVLRSTFKLSSDITAVLWPGHGFTDGDTAFIFLDEVENSTMANLGTHIAKLQLPDLLIDEIIPLAPYGSHQMGRAILTDSTSGYRYIYSNKLDWIVWQPFIARTPIGADITTPYEFFTGSAWSFDHTLAVPISNEPVSPGFSVIKYLDKYLLITQENGYLTCGLGREIYIYQSDSAWGPFSEKTLVYIIEDKFNGNYLLTYNAQVHPSLTENNELLISYNLNDWVDTLQPYICPSQCKDIWTDRMDADTYRPKFIRVPVTSQVGTPSMTRSSGFSISPNPVEAGSKVTLSGINTGIEITINDFAGTIINTFTTRHNNQPFSAPEKRGIYIIRTPQKSLKLVVI